MANEQRNGRNGFDDYDDHMRERTARDSDRDRDERFLQRDRDDRFMRRDRERSAASWDDRSRWDRDDDRSSGWRSIDRSGQGQSGYGSGNYLGQGGQQMGWGNDYRGHYGEPGYSQHTHYGQGYGQTGYGGGYGYSAQPGMGLGQHGNFRHESYSHLGQQNFGHLGPDESSNMSRGFVGSREDYRQEHPSFGQRVKEWFTGHRGKGPSGYTRSDERIRENVCEVLADDDRIDATFIEVSVEGGEVTLTGTVDNRQVKRMAEDCIENLSGVKDVHNHLRLMDRSRVAGTTGATSSPSSLSSSGMSSSTAGTTTVSGAMKDDRSTGQNGADKRNRM